MDPFTHWALGTTGALSLSKKDVRKYNYSLPLLFASLGAVFPDIDAFIQSADDSLLYIEYHRHFTHSILLSPVYSFLIALLGHTVFRLLKKTAPSFFFLWRWTLLGLVTHGFLDACTSYGTHLWWPLSSHRSAWNIVSIIDPLMTVPLVVLILLTVVKKNISFTRIGLIWACLYLSIGMIQREGVLGVYQSYLEKQNFSPIKRIDVKPSFANLWLWRGISYDGQYYRVDSIFKLPFTDVVINPGEPILSQNLDQAIQGFDVNSRAMKDLERFRFFSDDYLYLYRVEGSILSIGDLRYSLIPNSSEPLWIIQLDLDNQEAPVPYITVRDVTDEKKDIFRRLLKGEFLGVE
jgi:inner membrane protein